MAGKRPARAILPSAPTFGMKIFYLIKKLASTKKYICDQQSLCYRDKYVFDVASRQ